MTLDNEAILRKALGEFISATGGSRLGLYARTVRAEAIAALASTEPTWVVNKRDDDLCPVPAGSDVELETRDGLRERTTQPETFNWHPHRFDNHSIARYRVWKTPT